MKRLSTHLVTHTGPCNCPHGGTFKSTVGASDVVANGYKVTRIGDETVCQNCGMKGKHIVGSPNVFIGSVSSTNGAAGMGGWGSCGAIDSVNDAVDVSSSSEDVSDFTLDLYLIDKDKNQLAQFKAHINLITPNTTKEITINTETDLTLVTDLLVSKHE